MQKKILYFITKGNFGGAQKYVYDLATNAPSDKFEVVVACGEGNILKSKLEEKGVRVIKLASSQRDINIFKDIKTFFEIYKIIKQERPDILHLNSSKAGGLGSLAGRLVCLLSKSYHLKTIFTAHGWASNEERNFLEKTVILFLHWLTVLLSHTTITVSEKTKRDIEWLPFVGDKLKLIHNGVENFETTDIAEARETLARESRDKTIIFSIAELHKSKGIDVALRGIALLPRETQQKIFYCIAGSGEELDALKKLSKDLKIETKVRFLGFVENAKKLLSGADLFLFPSRNENLPFAVLEAGATGQAIIATSVGGIPEIIADMQNGILVPPRNPKEIAEAVIYLVNHPEKQKEFGNNIKKTVSENFSFTKMLRGTLSLYR